MNGCGCEMRRRLCNALKGKATDEDAVSDDAWYNESDYEILKSQFQTINLVRHEN